MKTWIALFAAGTVMLPAALAQASQKADKPERPEIEASLILIEDPEPAAPEYSEAQGSEDAEIVMDEALAAEADAAVALAGDIEGDMAAMPELPEEPEW
ncbi:MAG: hypothetical protein AAGJ29_09875 [Pseudomonadota bacterium]